MPCSYNYKTFFGGNSIFSKAQFKAVNGFGNAFWGHGYEDDNMVLRLNLHGMWPPERPTDWYEGLPMEQQHTWIHLDHSRHTDLQIAGHSNNNPKGLANQEPAVFHDVTSGLQTVAFSIQAATPYMGAVWITLDLHCDVAATPWCKADVQSAVSKPCKLHPGQRYCQVVTAKA